jgi:hypothetical protein
MTRRDDEHDHAPQRQYPGQEPAVNVRPGNIIALQGTDGAGLLGTVPLGPARPAAFEDVDEHEGEVAAELELVWVSHQAALATAANVLQPSLVEFLL